MTNSFLVGVTDPKLWSGQALVHSDRVISGLRIVAFDISDAALGYNPRALSDEVSTLGAPGLEDASFMPSCSRVALYTHNTAITAEELFQNFLCDLETHLADLPPDRTRVLAEKRELNTEAAMAYGPSRGIQGGADL